MIAACAPCRSSKKMKSEYCVSLEGGKQWEGEEGGQTLQFPQPPCYLITVNSNPNQATDQTGICDNQIAFEVYGFLLL